MFGLTPLGIIHTGVSLIAVLAGLVALLRDKRISAGNALGNIYIATTILTCLTALGIFQHGGFGKGHALAIVTLIVLAISYLTGKTHLFGRASPYVETVGYSATFLFHLIPAITEISTRLPLGNPLLASAEDPALQAATGVLFLLFLIVASLQIMQMRTK